ncbi:hypothetical protein SDC9_174574 [bioreactor metagenome]|uniref:Uncharacterized protein n=1 Tax=bioreactor metagenome TaxID=1076179 RepID=A0A645GJR7_9ZZZZ
MDGHEVCKHFMIRATKPVTAVRDAHHAIKAVTGVDLHGFAYEYEDDIIPQSVLEALDRLGFQFSEPLHQDDAGTHLLTADSQCDAPETMAQIWVFLLNQADPELQVELVEESEFPSLLICGPDEKGRYSDSVGYGLFHG